MALANTAEIMGTYEAVLANELNWYVKHTIFSVGIFTMFIGSCYIIGILR